MKLLAISGSLHQGSHNTDLLRGAAAVAPDGVDVELYYGLKDVPPYNADDDFPGDQPLAVRRLKEALDSADGILISTPEYNSSIPGQLKNAIDWASRPRATAPLRNKPVAVVGASSGMFGAVWAQAELRKALASAGARVLDAELPVPAAHTKFDEDGVLVDDKTRAGLRGVVEALVAVAAPATVAA